MLSFILLILLTDIKYDEYQKNECENVPSVQGGGGRPKTEKFHLLQ